MRFVNDSNQLNNVKWHIGHHCDVYFSHNQEYSRLTFLTVPVDLWIHKIYQGTLCYTSFVEHGQYDACSWVMNLCMAKSNFYWHILATEHFDYAIESNYIYVKL